LASGEMFVYEYHRRKQMLFIFISIFMLSVIIKIRGDGKFTLNNWTDW